MRPKRIIFHARSVENHLSFLELLGSFDLKDEMDFGVAVGANENLDYAHELIKELSFVQIMGIDNIGHQGESFNENVFAQIEALKEKYPGVIISIDGGVNLENAKRLKDAGVDRLVSGSTIFESENKEEVINKLRNE